MSRLWMTAIEKIFNEQFIFGRNFFYRAWAWAFLCSVLMGTVDAQEIQSNQPGMVPNGDTAQGNIGADDAEANTTQGEHPLEPALALASKGLESLRANIQDFSCTVVKRERINGALQPTRIHVRKNSSRAV